MGDGPEDGVAGEAEMVADDCGGPRGVRGASTIRRITRQAGFNGMGSGIGRKVGQAMTDRLRGKARETLVLVWENESPSDKAAVIHKALLSVRDEALEEAALECNMREHAEFGLSESDTCHLLAKVIRSLKSKSLDHPA